MSDTRSALIIGSGIAGPVAAMALRKAGIDAVVHEAHPSPTDGIGGALAIAPNGVAALSVVDAHHAVLDHSIPIDRQAMAIGRRRRATLPALTGMPPLRMVDRNLLQRSLHDLAVDRGIRIEHDTRLVDVQENRDGVTAIFDDGRTATADVLIGADGVRSTVRRLIDPDAPGPNWTGLLGFEGTADVDVPEPAGTMTFAFGRRAYYLYWPLPGGGTGWGANLPHHSPLTLTEARAASPTGWLTTLRDTYTDDDPGAALMRSTDPASLQVTGALHIMPSLPHWHRGRLVLVGDAAHAPSNSSGQGASLAVESAVELARCLRDLPDAPSAFAAFEELRRKRVEGIAARAARINRVKAPGPVARAFMAALMPMMMRVAMNPEKTLGSEQRFRIDWDAAVRVGSTV